MAVGAANRIAAALALVAAGACAADPVEWDAAIARRPAPPPDARLILDDRRAPQFVTAVMPLRLPPPQLTPTICAGSLRLAASTALDMYAAWWSLRPNRSVSLKVARSDDGGQTWRVPAVVDSTDIGGRGCDRPPPALAADARSGNVYVVYFIHGAEGPGVFFSHSMERGVIFHAPVPVVYGERPSDAAVAGSGDTVAVAYENPNSARPQISLAVSRTAGHLFERRTNVTGAGATADQPQVAVRGGRIAVMWLESGGGDTVAVMRMGRLR